MSVHFSVIRLSINTQIYRLSSQENKEFRSSFDLIELHTWGWSNGAKCRCKKLPTYKALGYINKLHAGGWICDAEYDFACKTVNEYIASLHIPMDENPLRSLDLSSASSPISKSVLDIILNNPSIK